MALVGYTTQHPDRTPANDTVTQSRAELHVNIKAVQMQDAGSEHQHPCCHAETRVLRLGKAAAACCSMRHSPQCYAAAAPVTEQPHSSFTCNRHALKLPVAKQARRVVQCQVQVRTRLCRWLICTFSAWRAAAQVLEGPDQTAAGHTPVGADTAHAAILKHMQPGAPVP